MSDLRIETPTTISSVDELRPLLDAALQKQFPGGMLKRQWNGDVLELSGPGAAGTIVLADGQIVGEAQLKPPASMMQSVIEQKITAAIEEVVSGG